MILVILLTVAVYSTLMVWMLAKVGSAPAQSVLDLVNGNKGRSLPQNRKTYEQTISAR
ncbi:hypothetical protein [Halobacillus sp. BBL2006]|uniref:hypothetical protein n=1 Tax=Halobacillus sp. BBL2006 TaxID=1543706 RepID=UPI000B1DB1F0|nr:hypothetical protein [Halobacillus sp. BBL2006]